MIAAPRSRRATAVVLAFTAAASAPAVRAGSAGSETAGPVPEASSVHLPMLLEAERGHLPAGVRFAGRTRECAVELAAGEVRLRLEGGAPTERAATGTEPVVVILRLDKAARREPIGEEPQTAVVSYFLGRDPGGWITGVPTVAQVRYPSVYPGIDMVVHGRRGRPEYDFELAPGTSPAAIGVVFAGADAVTADPGGGVTVRTGGRVLAHSAAVAYQPTGSGAIAAVEVRQNLDADGVLRFATGAYDPALPLVIDPALAYAAFVPAMDGEARAVAVDALGAVYLAGVATPPGRPNWKPSVAKIAADGRSLVYQAYFGGAGADDIRAVAVDAAGRATAVGATTSPDFPLANPLQAALRGARDGFVVRLSPDGTAPELATYLGGSSVDTATAVTITRSGDSLVAGYTSSSNFPVTSGAYDTSCGTNGACNAGAYPVSDAFVAKLTASGIGFATFLGGPYSERPAAIAATAGGDAIVGGIVLSESGGAMTRVSGPPAPFDGSSGGFLAKVAANGRSLSFLKALPEVSGVTVADSGGVAAAGANVNGTLSGAQQLGGGTAAFAVAFDAAGSKRRFASVFGGPETTVAGIVSAPDGRLVVAGDSAAFGVGAVSPLKVAASWDTLRDAFVLALGAEGRVSGLATRLGSPSSERIAAVARATGQDVVIAGECGWGVPLGLRLPEEEGSLPSGVFASRLSLGTEAADLHGSIAFLPGPRGPGRQLFHTVTIVNDGPSRVDDVAVSLLVPGEMASLEEASSPGGRCVVNSPYGGVGVCRVGALDAGARVDLLVRSVTRAAGTMTVEAVLSGSTGDPMPGNNTLTGDIEVGGTFDFSGSVSSFYGEVVQGDAIVFDVEIQGWTRVGDPSVKVHVDVPAAAALRRAVTTTGSCAATATGLLCEIDRSRLPGRISVALVAVAAGELTLTSRLQTSEPDDDPSNDDAVRTVLVHPAAPGRFVYTVPAVAHNAGAGGTLWRTDVSLVNTTPVPASLAVDLLDAAGAPPATVALGPGEQRLVEDVVETLFRHRGAASTAGALRVSSPVRVAIAARTYTAGSSGSYGQSFPALVPEDGFPVTYAPLIPWVERSDAFRTNIGVVNLGDAPCTVTVSAFNRSGGEIARFPVPLAARQWRQLYDPLAAGAQDARYAVLTRDEGECLPWGYASVVDRRSGDPTTVAMMPWAPSGPIVPGGAHTAGAEGSLWRTMLAVTDHFRLPNPVRLALVRDGTTTQRDVATDQQAALVVDDVLAGVFGAGAADNTVGTLVVMGMHFAVARTYNQTSRGTFGQSFPSLDHGAGVRGMQRGIVPLLRRDETYRTNLGLVATGTADCAATVTLHAPSGQQVGHPLRVLVKPQSMRQINDVLAAADAAAVQLAYAAVEIDSGSGQCWAWASLIDRRTGDPTTITIEVLDPTFSPSTW